MGRRNKPRRIPNIPSKPKATLKPKSSVKEVLIDASKSVAGGVAAYGAIEGIDSVVKGSSQNNNNNPIIIQMPSPESPSTTALATMSPPVSSDMHDLKIVMIGIFALLLVIFLAIIVYFWTKSKEKRAVETWGYSL